MQAVRPAVAVCATLTALATGLTRLSAVQERGGITGGRSTPAQMCTALPRAAGLPNASTVITAAAINPAAAAQAAQNPQAPPK